MTFSVPARKLALAVHVTAGVGWIGAVAAFLPLALVGVYSTTDAHVRSSFFAMNLLLRFVIVPLALASLASGLVSSLGTTWGLLRHYWVIAKLTLTLVAIAVLLVQLAPIAALADAAADPATTVVNFSEAKRPLIHAVGGIVVLLVVQALGVFKPRGLTRYGWRKENERAAQPPVSPESC